MDRDLHTLSLATIIEVVQKCENFNALYLSKQPLFQLALVIGRHFPLEVDHLWRAEVVDR
jgi:hypothetical protein